MARRCFSYNPHLARFETYNFSSRGPKLPPGPPIIPFLNNLYVLPKSFAHIKWGFLWKYIFSPSIWCRHEGSPNGQGRTVICTPWVKRYRPQKTKLTQLKLGPRTAILITSPRLVRELMDKRSASTVDRPPNFMGDIITGGLSMVLVGHSD